jgi:hypothetical protein
MLHAKDLAKLTVFSSEKQEPKTNSKKVILCG